MSVNIHPFISHSMLAMRGTVCLMSYSHSEWCTFHHPCALPTLSDKVTWLPPLPLLSLERTPYPPARLTLVSGGRCRPAATQRESQDLLCALRCKSFKGHIVTAGEEQLLQGEEEEGGGVLSLRSSHAGGGSCRFCSCGGNLGNLWLAALEHTHMHRVALLPLTFVSSFSFLTSFFSFCLLFLSCIWFWSGGLMNKAAMENSHCKPPNNNTLLSRDVITYFTHLVVAPPVRING